jgi:predicted protein tyrosine phosphatase
VRKVKFYPRRIAEAITVPHHIISIGEPGGMAKLHASHNVLPLSFHDLDMELQGYFAFSYSQAQEIIDWLLALPKDHTRVIVHCEAGISRSAAVAKFMIKDMGYELDPDKFCKPQFDLANTRVYGALRSAYHAHKKNIDVSRTHDEQ